MSAALDEPRTSGRERGPSPRAPRGVVAAGVVLALGLVALGGMERWWVASSTIGTLTSDGAVIGLMAMHLIHHGQFPAYMWGQAYGGSLEMLETAVVFVLFGTGTSQLLATTAATSAIVCLAMWRAARRIVGEPAAAIGALALWVWPVVFTWRSLKPGGSYVVGMALAWCALNGLARIKSEDHRRVVLVVTGVLLGLCIWTSPMTLQLLAPGVLWSFAALRGLRRRLVEVAAGIVVGGIPAWWFGLTHFLANFRPTEGAFYDGFFSRFAQFFEYELPIATSLRVEGSLHWVLGDASIALEALMVVAFGVLLARVARRRAPRYALPVLSLALLPVLYGANPYADHLGQGRYVMLGASMLPLLVGVCVDDLGRLAARRLRGGDVRRRTAAALARLVTAAVALSVLACLGVAALDTEPGTVLADFGVGGARVPASFAPLRTLLLEHHVHDAYATYWVAYRVTFELQEHVLVTPTSTGRYPPIREAVSASRDPAFVFVTKQFTLGWTEQSCRAHHVAYVTWVDGPFTVLEPDRRLTLHELPFLYQQIGPSDPANALRAPSSGGTAVR